METVYIVGIIALAVVTIIVVVLLKNRITSGKLTLTPGRVSTAFEAKTSQPNPKDVEIKHSEFQQSDLDLVKDATFLAQDSKFNNSNVRIHDGSKPEEST